MSLLLIYYDEIFWSMVCIGLMILCHHIIKKELNKSKSNKKATSVDSK